MAQSSTMVINSPRSHRHYDDSDDDKDHGNENDDDSDNQNHHESSHMLSHDAPAQEAGSHGIGIDSNSNNKGNCHDNRTITRMMSSSY